MLRCSHHTTRAHLLPKLRCQFAEFLLLSSLKRLRILISRTSVGLRYGRVQLKLSGFSWNLVQLLRKQACSIDGLGIYVSDLPDTHLLPSKPGYPKPGQPIKIRPHIALHIGTGILTCFPSATHLCLTLGADLLYADERCIENLALTASRLFSPALTLLMSAFALLISPAAFSSCLHRLTERSPTTHIAVHP